MPAEWECQRMVQLTWPHAGTDWAPMLDRITATYVEMAVEIARRERLLIVAPQPQQALSAIAAKAPAELLAQIDVMACDTNDTWARDHGFLTLVSGGDGRRLLDFRFNGWGAKFEAQKDNAINRLLYERKKVEGGYESHLDFVLEGGAVESDGKGTVMTTTGCLMAPNRNQPLTRAEIERQLKCRLHAERVVWIDHGSLAGDDTDGHVDTLVRMAPNDTLLYIGTGDGDPDDRQTGELLAMEKQLKQFRTMDGRPYRLLRLPLPRPIYDGDGRLPATYANFLVVNGAVLCPTYSQPDLDQAALDTIAQAFPDRDVVPIDCRSVICQHGSLHCCTMQYY